MRTASIASVVCLILVAVCAPVAGDWTVRTDFEGGCAKLLSADPKEGLVRVQPAGDPKLGWPCWWAFQLSGVDAPRTVTVEVVASGLLGPDDKPFDPNWARPRRAAWSSDGKVWQQTPDGLMDKAKGTVRYQVRMEGPQAYFAWCQPFTGVHGAELAALLARTCPDARAGELCRTAPGRPVPLLRVGRSGPGKRGVWFQARQHAWECGSSWVAAGLMEWLTGDDERAKALRQQAVVVVVPVMDVDTVAVGGGGKNRPPYDHNRDWNDKPIYESVAAAQKEILAMDRAGNLDMFIDLHNPGCNDLEPFFMLSQRSAWTEAAWAGLQRFAAACRTEMTGPLAFKGRLQETGPKYDPKLWRSISGQWVRDHVWPGVISCTLETPWFLPACSTDNVKTVGRQLGLAVERYLRENPRPQPAATPDAKTGNRLP